MDFSTLLILLAAILDSDFDTWTGLGLFFELWLQNLDVYNVVFETSIIQGELALCAVGVYLLLGIIMTLANIIELAYCYMSRL